MKEDKLYEVVEVCPHCDHENIWNVSLVETRRPIRTCQKCGRKIFICSECEALNEFCCCDWHRNPDESHECYRGRILTNK